MKSKKNNIEISEKEVIEKENLVEVQEVKTVKPKRVLSESQSESLAKARISMIKYLLTTLPSLYRGP
jgi:hypothetical protein